MPPPSTSQMHSNEGEPCSTIDTTDADLVRRLCDIYAADFACFPSYQKPPACLGNARGKAAAPRGGVKAAAEGKAAAAAGAAKGKTHARDEKGAASYDDEERRGGH